MRPKTVQLHEVLNIVDQAIAKEERSQLAVYQATGFRNGPHSYAEACLRDLRDVLESHFAKERQT